MLTKALKNPDLFNKPYTNLDELWKLLMLAPKDYGAEAIYDKTTRNLMEKIIFEHGGPEYDKRYPDGIPTSVEITLKGIELLITLIITQNNVNYRWSEIQQWTCYVSIWSC